MSLVKTRPERHEGSPSLGLQRQQAGPGHGSVPGPEQRARALAAGREGFPAALALGSVWIILLPSGVHPSTWQCSSVAELLLPITYLL